MNWFEGEIAQAIISSKAKQAIFVVHAYGKDEKSSQFLNSINQQEVLKILNCDHFVAIKVEARSLPYEQFKNIYKEVPVPSLFFIGKSGVVLDMIKDVLDVKTLQERLNNTLVKGGFAPIALETQDFIATEQAASIPPKEASPIKDSSPKADSVICDNDVCTIIKNEQPSTSQDKSEPEKNEETDKELTVEEKVERAKQLVEKKREEKLKEEMEKERLQELERRKVGQNVQQLKRWQDDQELKAVLEEREKERREGQAARERVLAQIAQDKAERAAKFSPPGASLPTQAAAPSISPRPVNTNSARIQFKMPDGRTATNDFSSSDTLENVHAYIKANLNLSFSSYTLSTTFPRREFTESENKQSLLELGLVPTAVILILPLNRGTVSTNASGGGVTGLLWNLLTPFFTILGYLKTFVFGAGPPENSNATDNQNKRPSDSNNEPRTQPKVRKAGETTVIRKQGNVHRLSNKNDSDDENNTWNGNSTQQM